ncbi:hypothetical protein TNCV_3006751 [Trichonephila clavipes]|nr:hypothetical protein TNCV_3006751 [Trichonephila clavipes]
MESFLIEEVEKLPYLWNPRHPHFTKRLKKNWISADRHEDEREVAGTRSSLHASGSDCFDKISPKPVWRRQQCYSNSLCIEKFKYALRSLRISTPTTATKNRNCRLLEVEQTSLNVSDEDLFENVVELPPIPNRAPSQSELPQGIRVFNSTPPVSTSTPRMSTSTSRAKKESLRAIKKLSIKGFMIFGINGKASATMTNGNLDADPGNPAASRIFRSPFVKSSWLSDQCTWPWRHCLLFDLAEVPAPRLAVIIAKGVPPAPIDNRRSLRRRRALKKKEFGQTAWREGGGRDGLGESRDEPVSGSELEGIYFSGRKKEKECRWRCRSQMISSGGGKSINAG